MICGLLLTIEIMNESFSDVSVEPGMGLVFSPSLGRGQGRRVRADTTNTGIHYIALLNVKNLGLIPPTLEYIKKCMIGDC